MNELSSKFSVGTSSIVQWDESVINIYSWLVRVLLIISKLHLVTFPLHQITYNELVCFAPPLRYLWLHQKYGDYFNFPVISRSTEYEPESESEVWVNQQVSFQLSLNYAPKICGLTSTSKNQTKPPLSTAPYSRVVLLLPRLPFIFRLRTCRCGFV